MKRLNHAFVKICDFGNLKKAAYKARKSKYGIEAQKFFYHLEYNLLDLQEHLTSKNYRPGPFHTFTILDPKKRQIAAAPFIDRIVHHAICNILEPWFERFYIFDSYACRKEKGQHRALKRAQQFSRKYSHFFKFDIQQFFASVDIEVLKKILRRKIKDVDVLWLLDVILDHSPKDQGLPIGNLTSQHFANLYLHELDHFIKHNLRIPGYCRYMDDAIIYDNDKERLWLYKLDIVDFLQQQLHLQLNEKSSYLGPRREGIPFLGFQIFPRLIRLQRKNWIRFRRRFKQRQQQCLRGEITTETLVNSINSMFVHIAQGDTKKLRQLLLDDHELDF